MKHTREFFGLFLAVICLGFLAGCSLFQEPTIKSPISGRDVTLGQLHAEGEAEKIKLQAEASQAEADLQSELAALQGEQVSKLAAIEAKYKPIIAGVSSKIASLGATLKASADAIEAKAQMADNLLGIGISTGSEIVKNVPGWGIIGTLGISAIGNLVQAIRGSKTKSVLSNLAQAVATANVTTPAGEHDATWDKSFNAIAKPEAKAVIAKGVA
jgi:hypothetical protein